MWEMWDDLNILQNRRFANLKFAEIIMLFQAKKILEERVEYFEVLLINDSDEHWANFNLIHENHVY